MYLSRIELNREAAGVRDVLRMCRGDNYQIHRQVWSFFADSPNRRRDFLYRQETTQGWPRLYTVSERRPVDPSGIWSIAIKPYQPSLKPGTRLMFSLRVNPVRTRRDAEHKQHRHDVIMDAKTRLKLEKGEHVAVSAAEVVQEQGAHWLISRAAKHGFDVDAGDVRADGYLQHSLMNKQRRISFSTLDFNGVLTVIDPEKLIDALYHGVGPAKGFGCGLILVRRI